MVSIYTLAFNEQLLIKKFIDFYKKNIPSCNITIYDNMSTDDTAKIALENDCTVISYDTNNKLSDRKYLEIKNSCYHQAKTDWILVCDMDEFLDITDNQLMDEQTKGTTIIQSQCYNMVNMENNLDVNNILYGYRDSRYDKNLLFNKLKVNDINYGWGCHSCNPTGIIKKSDKLYNIYHYRFISPDYLVARYRLYNERLSDENRRMGWGYHYVCQESKIRQDYENSKNMCIKLL